VPHRRGPRVRDVIDFRGLPPLIELVSLGCWDLDRPFCEWMIERERIQALNPIAANSSWRSA
jgi:hypothetical protein